VVSRHSAREKSIRHGHPSTLHLWWARRPLAACRAVLMALLLPDPCDENCPADFKEKARELLPPVQGRPGPSDKDLREALLRFIGDFANWDNAAVPKYLTAARGLVKAAHPEETPLVVDPFAGGGSIPLEALRLACEAFASDLNPVACLILKTLLEDIPRHGPELAEELRRAGEEIKAAAEKELAQFYPPDPDGAKPSAYLWARTVRCEAPNCGAEIPLVRSFWLSKKIKRRRALRYRAVRSKTGPPRTEMEVFEPSGDADVPRGTITNGRATCPCCGNAMDADRLRAQLTEAHVGGGIVFDKSGKRVGGARLLAVVSLKPDDPGRHYRTARDDDYAPVLAAQRRLAEAQTKPTRNGQSLAPDEPINPQRPSPNARGLSAVTRYGMSTFGDLFTARQKLALLKLAEKYRTIPERMRPFVVLAVSRVSERLTTLSRWDNSAKMESVAGTFARQALSMVWDFAEQNPFTEIGGNWEGALDWVIRAVSQHTAGGKAEVHLADATESPLPDCSASVLFTDPPYYDAIPYADLSDFFFVWLKRMDPHHSFLRDPFDASNPLTPKSRECVWNQAHIGDGKPKDGEFFERTITKCFAEGRRILHEDGVTCIVFAHKTTEGWEALLSGITRSGWIITASWPVSTEMQNRVNARDTASLATSVHLVCRPRTTDETGDWEKVYRELPGRVGDWMERLQGEGVRGADLVFACIGPALEIYSRYAKVEDAEGHEIPLGGDPEAKEPYKRGYLAYVWEAVGRAALQQILGTAEAKARNGAAGAVEEDARLTALFLWTLQSTDATAASATEDTEDTEAETDEDESEEGGGSKKAKKGFALVYDVARRFAQPLGIHLEAWEGRVIEIEKGVVRLLSVAERAKQLFGEEDAQSIARRLESTPTGPIQGMLFPELANQPPQLKARAPKGKGRGKAASSIAGGADAPAVKRQPTILDRVHAAMLLQASGQTNALRALLRSEQERSPDFLRLANALSALYPKDSEEKRLLDAMLLAVPR
jgi:adenine-specific DNA methylase